MSNAAFNSLPESKQARIRNTLASLLAFANDHRGNPNECRIAREKADTLLVRYGLSENDSPQVRHVVHTYYSPTAWDVVWGVEGEAPTNFDLRAMQELLKYFNVNINPNRPTGPRKG